MELDEYRKHYELEGRHWWFLGRRDIILTVLDGLEGLPADARILDAGCGTGLNLKILRRYGQAFGLDSYEEAIRYCRKRGLSGLVRADTQKMPFQGQSFDIVLLLDVLSHQGVSSDRGVLSETYFLLKKGGFLLVWDSAFRFLTSRHDRAFHIRERYTSRGMIEKLKLAGFEVQRSGYFNFFLFFPVVLYRFWDKLRIGDRRPPVSHLKKVNSGVNSLLYRIFRTEASLLRHLRFPFGSSCLCVAIKK